MNNTPAVGPGAAAPVFFLQDGFPANFLNPADLNLQNAHIRAANPHMPNAMTQQWSFGVQRELPGDFFAELNYVGTHSTHLQELADLNMPVNGVLPYSNFGYIEYDNAIADGHYNGLEVSLTHRTKKWPPISPGVDLVAQYRRRAGRTGGKRRIRSTLCKITQWTGPSDFDTPQRVVFSYVYDLPAGRGHQLFSHGLAAQILGNWRTSGVYTFSNGLPFTVYSGGSLTTALDPNGASDPVNTAVPNVIGKALIVGNVNCWYYASQNPYCDALAPNATDAFQLQQSGQFGNSGRNSLRGPHTNVFDFALLKDFVISENKTVQFRWELFNAFNTPIFANPSTDFAAMDSPVKSPSLAGDPRVMQFALRFAFLMRLKTKAVALLCAQLLAIQNLGAWGIRGHTLVNLVAVETIPADGPVFLKAQKAYIGHLGTIPDTWRSATEPFLRISEDANHSWYTEGFDFIPDPPRSRTEFILRVYDEYRRTMKSDPDRAKLLNIRYTGLEAYSTIEGYERMKAGMRVYRRMTDPGPHEI